MMKRPQRLNRFLLVGSIVAFVLCGVCGIVGLAAGERYNSEIMAFLSEKHEKVLYAEVSQGYLLIDVIKDASIWMAICRDGLILFMVMGAAGAAAWLVFWYRRNAGAN